MSRVWGENSQFQPTLPSCRHSLYLYLSFFCTQPTHPPLSANSYLSLQRTPEVGNTLLIPFLEQDSVYKASYTFISRGIQKKVETLILSSLRALSLLSGAVCTPAVTADSLQGGGRRRRHLKFTRQTSSRMSMLGESLLNSLFTSSIPLTSFTLRVTLFFFFFSLSLLSLSCVPSIFLPPFFFSPPHAWLHTCVYLSTLLKLRVSTSSVKDERKVCEHACAALCMSNRLICPKEPRVSRDVLSPSLQLSSTQPFANAAVTPDLLPAKKNESSLFFWYTVLLKSPSFKKKKHLDQEVTKKQGNDMQQGLSIVWMWSISSRRFDAMLFEIQQGEF